MLSTRWMAPLAVSLAIAISGASQGTPRRPNHVGTAEQTQDGITVKLLGARYDAKEKQLLVRVEAWGNGVDTANFGSPAITADGQTLRSWGSSVTSGTGKPEKG